LRQQLAELEHEISASQQRATELKGNADREENRIHFHEERLRELESQNARALSEITQAEERKLLAEQEVADLVERIRGAEARVAELRTLLEERRCALTAVEQELIEKQRTLRQAQSDAFASAQTLSKVRNELTALDLQKEAHAVRIQKISAEKIQLEEERLRLEARITEFQANVEAEKAGVAAKRGTVEERQARLRELQQELQEAGRELDAITRRQAEVRSKLNVLEQLESSHEGFSSGALAALQGNGGVLGSLADRIRVPEGRHIAAVEAALGHHLQLVLAEQPETACSILSDLTAGRKGRASIAALRWNDASVGAPDSTAAQGADFGAPEVVATADTEAPTSTEAPVESASTVGEALPPGVSRLIDAVEADESVRPLLRGLLGRTLLAPTLDVASAARRQTGEDYDYVTEAGELLSRHGVFTGGTGNGNGKPSSSILARKNQITELRAQATQLLDEVETASRHRGALQAEQTELQAGLQEAQTELRAQEVAVATHQGEFNALVNSRRILEQRVDAVVYEIESLAAQEREGTEKREALAQRLVAAEAAETEAQLRVTTQTGEIEGLRLNRDEANAALTDTKVTFASEEQSLSGLARQRAPLEQRIREMGALVEQRRAECGGFLQRKAQSESDIVAARASIERLNHEREVVNGQIAELGSRRDGQVSASSKSTRSTRRRSQRVHHDHDRRRRARPHCKRGTPEEMAASGASTDWASVSDQVTALQKRIDEMGPVNLVAIEEYEEAEQRHTFLSAAA
jgi:chromosome segregation protein